jgi:phosphopentomutase
VACFCMNPKESEKIAYIKALNALHAAGANMSLCHNMVDLDEKYGHFVPDYKPPLWRFFLRLQELPPLYLTAENPM